MGCVQPCLRAAAQIQFRNMGRCHDLPKPGLLMDIAGRFSVQQPDRAVAQGLRIFALPYWPARCKANPEPFDDLRRCRAGDIDPLYRCSDQPQCRAEAGMLLQGQFHGRN